MTLWDKLSVSCPGESEENLLAKNRLSAAIVFTAQGIPFFLSGEEFARTKPVEGSDKPAENSYNLPFYTNSIKYGRAKQFEELQQYYKGLIAFRKAHAGLRLRSTEEVVTELQFVPGTPENVVAFTITTEKECIFVVYNANEQPVDVEIPVEGAFQVYVEGSHAGTDVRGSVAKQARVEAVSCLAAVTSL
jgi:pullulanase